MFCTLDPHQCTPMQWEFPKYLFCPFRCQDPTPLVLVKVLESSTATLESMHMGSAITLVCIELSQQDMFHHSTAKKEECAENK
eukprot:768381-Ditylum_brightwellii.AAC.1